MVGNAQVNQLVEEDAGEDVIRGAIEAVRDTNGPVYGGAGAPTLAHRPPGYRSRPFIKVWQMGCEQLERQLLQNLVAPFVTGFPPEDEADHLGDDLAFLLAGHPVRDMNFNKSVLSDCSDAAFATGATNDPEIGEIGRKGGF